MAELSVRDFVADLCPDDLLAKLRSRAGSWALLGRGGRHARKAGMWLACPRCWYCGQETVWPHGRERNPWNGAMLDPADDVLCCQVCAGERGHRRRRPWKCGWPSCESRRAHDHRPFELGPLGQHHRLAERVDVMFARDPRCRWCGEPTVRATLLLPGRGPGGLALLRRALQVPEGAGRALDGHRALQALRPTFDHLYPKWDPRRSWHEYEGVLAHDACNHYRGQAGRPFALGPGGTLRPQPHPAPPASLAAAWARKRRALPWWRRLLAWVSGRPATLPLPRLICT